MSGRLSLYYRRMLGVSDDTVATTIFVFLATLFDTFDKINSNSLGVSLSSIPPRLLFLVSLSSSIDFDLINKHFWSTVLRVKDAQFNYIPSITRLI